LYYVRNELDCFTLQETLSFTLRRKQMADTIYGPDPWSDLRREFTTDHADIRRELAVGQGEIRYDIATTAAHTRTENASNTGEIRTQINAVSDLINSDIKETGWRVNEKVAYEGDRASKDASDYFIANQAEWPVEQSGPRQSRRVIKDALAVGCNLIGLNPIVPSFAEDKLKALTLAGKAGSLA
jgi:hypothetical protein